MPSPEPTGWLSSLPSSRFVAFAPLLFFYFFSFLSGIFLKNLGMDGIAYYETSDSIISIDFSNETFANENCVYNLGLQVDFSSPFTNYSTNTNMFVLFFFFLVKYLFHINIYINRPIYSI